MGDMTVGTLIRRYAKLRGMSIALVARRAGISGTGLLYIVNGRTKRPDMATLVRVAAALDADPNELLEAAGYQVNAPAQHTARNLPPEVVAVSDILNDLPPDIQALAYDDLASWIHRYKQWAALNQPGGCNEASPQHPAGECA